MAVVETLSPTHSATHSVMHARVPYETSPCVLTEEVLCLFAAPRVQLSLPQWMAEVKVHIHVMVTPGMDVVTD